MTIDLAYATGSAVSITNSEISIGVTGGTTTGVPVSRTDVGVYQFFIDGVANMVKGDTFLFKVYETARASGTVRVVFQATLANVQTEIFVTPQLMLGIGWDATLDRISASSRDFDWSVRRIY